MRITSRRDPPAVQISGLIELAQFFQGLPAMVVGRRVLRIRRQNGFKLLNGAIQVAGPDVLHRQTITCKGVGGIIGHELT